MIERTLTRDQQELTLGIVAYLSSLEGVYSSGETIMDIYWDNPKYEGLFFWDEDDNLNSKDETILKDFVEEVHRNEILKEFEMLTKEGICEKGLDKEGKIVYFPVSNNGKIDLVSLVYKRLKEKN